MKITESQYVQVPQDSPLAEEVNELLSRYYARRERIARKFKRHAEKRALDAITMIRTVDNDYLPYILTKYREVLR